MWRIFIGYGQIYAILYKGLEHPQIWYLQGFLEPISNKYWETTVLQGAERNQWLENLKSAHMGIINQKWHQANVHRTYVAIKVSNVNLLQGRVLQTFL